MIKQRELSTEEIARRALLRDKSLRVSDENFRMLADTTAVAMFTCWGERLLLRMADRELRRIKNRREKTVRSEVTDEYAGIR